MVAKFLDLDRDGHLHCRIDGKKSMGYRFAPEFNHAQERLYTCHFFRFFFVLLPWQRDVTTSLSIREGTCLLLVLLPRSIARNVLASRRQSLGTPNILY